MTTTTASFEIDGVTVSTGDRISLEGEISTVTRIAGRWVALSNGGNISRADAAAARAEYLARNLRFESRLALNLFFHCYYFNEPVSFN